jgi:transcriptional antiterminator NusG
MMVEQRLFKKGEFVEMVDLAQFGPLEVRIPKKWYVLKLHPNREAKVMRTFRQRNISAYLPTITSSQTVTQCRRGFDYQIQRNVSLPLFPGLLFIPDFEFDEKHRYEVDGVIGLLRFGDWTAFLTPKLFFDIRCIEAIGNTPKSKRERAFEIGQLVRVVNGPFRSFCALVERVDSGSRITIGIEIFGRITPSVVSESDIEAV